MDALSLLTGDAQAFCEKVWASHVHLHHTDPEPLVELLSLADVDRLLTGSALRTPFLRVVQDGTVLPASRFTTTATMTGSPVTGLVDGRKVLELFAGGATVVLQGLHRYWPPLTELVRDLELRLGHPCQANAYLTPPGSQGFARHSDTHDVFVFQTHGSKQWEVVDGGPGDDGVRQVTLEPGLSMYLPTGTPHSARSQTDTSLHVTIGINQVTWRDLLRRAVEQVLEDPRHDAHLPAGDVASVDRIVEGLGERLAGLAETVSTSDPRALAEAHRTRFLSHRPSVLPGGLLDQVGLGDLDDSTRLERRPTAACVVRRDGERVHLLLGDRELRMPVRLTEVLEFVRDHPSFTVGELAPWLDPQSRLVVCRRLVREGLLRISR